MSVSASPSVALFNQQQRYSQDHIDHSTIKQKNFLFASQSNSSLFVKKPHAPTIPLSLRAAAAAQRISRHNSNHNFNHINNDLSRMQPGPLPTGLNDSQSLIQNASFSLMNPSNNITITTHPAPARLGLKTKNNSNHNNNLNNTTINQSSILGVNQSSILKHSVLDTQESQQTHPLRRSSQSHAQLMNMSTHNHNMSTTKLFQSTSKKNFYHHSNIFNLKQYSGLVDHMEQQGGVDNRELIYDQQRSLLIREFRTKVDQYLLFSKYKKEQATKEFSHYYEKIQDKLGRTSLHGTNTSGNVSFSTQNNMTLRGQDQMHQSMSVIMQGQNDMNKSLMNIDVNRFHYSKLSKDEAALINNMSIDIYLEDSVGKPRLTSRKFDHRKLQDRILDKMKPLLTSVSDADYGERILHFTREYEKILEKMHRLPFRINLPIHYEPQMQPFNEFYSIDMSKKRPTVPNWNAIDEQLVQQVLDDSYLDDELQEEDEDDFDDEGSEESEYEEIEVEVEVPVSNVEQNLPQRTDINQPLERFELQQNPAAVTVQETVKVKQVMKVQRRKKEKKPKPEGEYIPSEDNQPFGEDPIDVSSNHSRQHSNYQGSPTDYNKQGKVAERKRKPKNDAQRSAMDEYVVYRPSTPVRPRKKDPSTPSVRQGQPTTTVRRNIVQSTIRPPQQAAQPSVVIPQQQQQPTIQSSSSSQAGQSTQRLKTEEDQSPVLQKDTSQNKIVPPVQIPVPDQQIPKQTQDSHRSPKNEIPTQANTNQTPRANSNNVQILDMSQPPQQQKKVPSQHRKQPSEIPAAPGAPRVVAQEEQEGQQEVQNEESEDEYEDVVVFEEQIEPVAPPPIAIPSKRIIEIQKQDEPQSRVPSAKEKVQSGKTLRIPIEDTQESVETEGQEVVQQEEKVDQSQPIGGISYLNDLAMKKKLGTGLIDELVKFNYLLDVNVTDFKKERKKPELPSDLQFKGEDDKQLFGSIFVWQYEVDQEIEEMEKKLNTKKKDQNQRHESDDDEDEEGKDEKNSINSSEITDFGPAQPFKNDIADLSSDNFSDLE